MPRPSTTEQDASSRVKFFMARARFEVRSASGSMSKHPATAATFVPQFMNRAREAGSSASTTTYEESDVVKDLMANARAKYAANPELLSKEQIPADTQNEFNFDKTLDATLRKSEHLLCDAQTQLGAPIHGLNPLTAEEQAEIERKEEWDTMRERTDDTNNVWLSKYDDLFDDLIALMDDFEAADAKVIALDEVEMPDAPATPPMQDLDVDDEIGGWIMVSKADAPPVSSPSSSKAKKERLDVSFSEVFAALFLGGQVGKNADIWAGYPNIPYL